MRTDFSLLFFQRVCIRTRFASFQSVCALLYLYISICFFLYELYLLYSLQVVPSTDYIYSVSDEGKSFIVCLENKSCTCKRFQMDGIPCPHAWAVLNNKNMLPDAYCSDFYKPKTVLKTYEVPVYPLPDVTEWNVPEHIAEEIVLPPRYKRPPGRPKKQRDKSFSELSKRKGTNSCSRCGNRGHNKRSCRAAPRNV
ncbi:hypothetical protein MTR67_048347 [Solanum verrucosum]|uniref:SWIM-type domain-containing protein n=1 Tax=Solanum verrucosum TaxID=315347 RepID=A0AAF0ZWD4_SOLVR|nr:hypothetical protein MTR67_048347 [Solanum verrucosum]